MLTEWILENLSNEVEAVDIGAGDGDSVYQDMLRPRVAQITGIDPSDGVRKHQSVDVRVQATAEEYAANSNRQFDLASAVYVVEHIRHPESFMQAAYDLVQPGGHLYLLTPSRHHYFGAIATIANRLRIDEWILARLRSDEVLHDHHFGIQYRLNTRRRIEALGKSVGFSKVEFRVMEDPGIFAAYLPNSFAWAPRLYAALVHRLQAKAFAGTLVARLTR